MPCSAGQNSFLYDFPDIGVEGSGNYTGLNVKQFYSLTKGCGQTPGRHVHNHRWRERRSSLEQVRVLSPGTARARTSIKLRLAHTPELDVTGSAWLWRAHAEA